MERSSAGEATWSATRAFTLEKNPFLVKFVEKDFGDAVTYKTTGIFVKYLFPEDHLHEMLLKCVFLQAHPQQSEASFVHLLRKRILSEEEFGFASQTLPQNF